MKLEWEEVEDDHAGYMYRARVEDGYLYKQVWSVQTISDDIPGINEGHFCSGSICYVPDKVTTTSCGPG